MHHTRHSPSLTEGPVPAVLIRLAIPMMAVSLGIVLFNLTDTFFVGKLGALPLAAISFTFPVILFTGSIFMGLGVGTSVNVSHALGSGNMHLARKVTTSAHLLSGIVSLVLMITGLLTIDPLFKLLGAKAEVLPLIREYMLIWFTGLPFIALSMVSTHVIQAGGDTRTPGLLMTTSLGINIILDPLLIFGIGPFPTLGISGAAISTVLARSLPLIFGLWIVARREKLFSFKKSDLLQIPSTWSRILHIGVPASFVHIMHPLSMGIITRLVSQNGILAVAGLGVATRIETFALILMMAMSMVLTPFSGQNAGAGNFGRIRQGVHYSALFSLGWSVVAFIVFLLFSSSLAALFNSTDEVVNVASEYLTILALSYGFQGTVLMVSAAFNGLHMPWKATTIAVGRLFGLFIPLAWLASSLFGLKGLFIGAASANIIAGILSFIWFESKIKSRISGKS